MGTVKSATTIPVPPERVWAVIADPSSYENWLTIHTKWNAAPDSFSEGATAEEVVTMLGMANTIAWTVEQFEAPSRLTISGTGMAGVRTTFSLGVDADEDGGSTATIDAEFDGQLIVGALGKAVEADARQNLDRSLANLAKLLA